MSDHWSKRRRRSEGPRGVGRACGRCALLGGRGHTPRCQPLHAGLTIHTVEPSRAGLTLSHKCSSRFDSALRAKSDTGCVILKNVFSPACLHAIVHRQRGGSQADRADLSLICLQGAVDTRDLVFIGLIYVAEITNLVH